jgi:ribosome-associated heat shock protein Hsp15
LQKNQATLKVRVDKYLWAIRVFKTRSLASEACSKGKVFCNSQPVKPSYSVKIGDTYHIKISADYNRIVEVIQFTEKRGSADIAKEFYLDHSPSYEKKKTEDDAFFSSKDTRTKGTGRPTKKERRALQSMKDLNCHADEGSI